LHDDLINFRLPPAAQKVYFWLTRRSKPGTFQEFDKNDFDRYCLDRGRKAFSIQWFVKCIKELVNTGLLVIQRQYRGYGYKVKAYHPWQINPPNPGDPAHAGAEQASASSSNKNCENSNKTCENSNENFSNSNKNFKKEASNNDPAVHINREVREKQDNLEQNVVAETEKCPNKGEKQPVTRINTKPIEKPVKPDLNPDPAACKKLDGKGKSSRQVEQKLNKKQEECLNKLEDVGIPVNETIVNAVKVTDPEKITKTIAYYREQKRNNYIDNPGGYFIKALQENWAEKNVNPTFEEIKPENKTSIFLKWYDLAKELGICTGQKIENNDRLVLVTGSWEKWEKAYKRGYTIEYLVKSLKRHKDYGK